MDEYISEWEMLTTKLTSIGEPMDETTLVTMFLESFGASQHKVYGTVITALQTKDELTWEHATTRLLQEYFSRIRKQAPNENIALYSKDNIRGSSSCDWRSRGRGHIRSRGRSYHGFSSRKGSRRGDSSNKCYYCGEEDCRKWRCPKLASDILQKEETI